MYIGLTPELTELRDELRDYYAKLLTPEVEAELSTRARASAPSRARSGSRWRPTAGPGSAGPKEYGGQGRTAIEQFIFFDESMRVGAPVPMLTINSVAPTIMRYGSPGAEGLLPAEDPGRRDPLRDRLHRARRGHRPRVAQDPGRARRRRVRDQRAEGLHLARDRRRLHLARGAHRPERQEAQGHLDHHRPDGHARLQGRADQEHGRPRHERHVLRGRARPGREPRRRARTRAGTSSPTSSTTSGSRSARAGWWSASSRTRSRGRRPRRTPTAPA